MLERLLRHSLRKTGAAARLDWLDTGLQSVPTVRKGFGTVFPQFIAEMASYSQLRLNDSIDSCLRPKLGGDGKHNRQQGRQLGDVTDGGLAHPPGF